MIRNKVDPKIDRGKRYEIKASKINRKVPRNEEEHLKRNSVWQEYPSRNIPLMLNYGHIYHYLIESASFNGTTKATDESSGRENDFCDSLTMKPLKKFQNIIVEIPKNIKRVIMEQRQKED